MKVAAAQFAPVFKNPIENLRAIEVLTQEAARNEADLIVFPELCISGYSFMSKAAAELYCEDVVPTIPLMQRGSTSLNIAIAWGYISKDKDGNLYNTQTLCLPNSSQIHYQKRNLWGNDFLWSTTGKVSPPIIDYKGKKIGLLICRDIRDKDDIEDDFYEPGDADIVAFSANFGVGGFPSVSWMDFVKNNKVTLVVSNRYGKESHNDFGHGGTCIIRPEGQVECNGLKWSEPCIVYADV